MTRWIEATTVGDLLLRSAESRPDATALVFPEVRRSYAELVAGARRMARGLYGLGIRRGDHVGILMPNCVELVEAFFGASLLGAVVVPLNARYRSSELAYVVENADLATLLTSDIVAEHVDYVPLLHAALPGLQGAAEESDLRLDAAPRLRSVVLFGGRTAPGMVDGAGFAALAEAPAAEVDRRREFVRLRDVAVLLYTSGTTAHPKGCPHTHDGLIRIAVAAGERFEIGPEDRFWDPLPMFHMSAILPLLFTLGVGGRFVSMTHFDAGTALRQMGEERATALYTCFPPITMAVLNHPDFATTDLSAARVMLNVAPPDTMPLIQKAIPQAVQISSYGITEAGGVVSYNELSDDDEQREHTGGRPLRGVEVEVVDPDGTVLAAGEPGELLVRGIGMCEGYYKDPVRTAEVIDADGWLHTGDLCALDPGGRIAYLGRIKEMLKVGGENVAPAEIEAQLSLHPAVQLVAAVGVPDERLVEVPAVFVELKRGATASEQELIDFCRGRIAGFKVPRYVRFLTEWPMSATKIQRFRLREQLLAELGGSVSSRTRPPGRARR